MRSVRHHRPRIAAPIRLNKIRRGRERSWLSDSGRCENRAGQKRIEFAEGPISNFGELAADLVIIPNPSRRDVKLDHRQLRCNLRQAKELRRCRRYRGRIEFVLNSTIHDRFDAVDRRLIPSLDRRCSGVADIRPDVSVVSRDGLDQGLRRVAPDGSARAWNRPRKRLSNRPAGLG